uniref:glucan endo-1,3-beta-D-glucosidase n=1 Tax=Anthurium amnicola TaxID=1678845 RepID=A0A1D1YCH7_9ARAE
MAISDLFDSRQACILLLFSLFTSEWDFLIRQVSCVGINYGQVANNLPPPEQVLSLLNSIKITKARIYDTNPHVLTTFANSGVELIVTVPNEVVATLTDPRQAFQWVETHVKPYYPATRIAGISVGNEVYTTDDPALVANLVPAMVGIHGALAQLGLDPYIFVSTSNSLGVLQSSYPPSLGAFRPELAGEMEAFLGFLEATRSPFWINAYPYFAYRDDPDGVTLDYVLSNPNPGMTDPNTRLRYDNMLYAQVDAVVFAMARMGFGGIEVRVSETGWPSGGNGEITTVEMAMTYNNNAVRHALRGGGTPKRPWKGIELYLFAMFNEDQKPPGVEQHFGLFNPDMSEVYHVNFTVTS